jgi:hypothetical protein
VKSNAASEDGFDSFYGRFVYWVGRGLQASDEVHRVGLNVFDPEQLGDVAEVKDAVGFAEQSDIAGGR